MTTGKNPLRVGDRVRVYKIDPSSGTAVFDDGVITHLDDYRAWVRCKTWPHDVYFRGQCRRLVKQERRSVWVRPYALNPRKNDGENFMNLRPVNPENYIEFREVLKPRKGSGQ